MLTEEELIENLAIHLSDYKWSESELIRMLTKLVDSINSTRQSERRANGSNSKTKELCPECGEDSFEDFGTYKRCRICDSKFF